MSVNMEGRGREEGIEKIYGMYAISSRLESRMTRSPIHLGHLWDYALARKPRAVNSALLSRVVCDALDLILVGRPDSKPEAITALRRFLNLINELIAREMD